MPSHSEKKFLPYPPEKMYELVADVEQYPNFLPWCQACKIFKRKDNILYADLTIGYKVYRETFTSQVTLSPSKQIDVKYLNGPFKYLDNRWIFYADEENDGCIIDFHIDFEFKSKLLQKILQGFFNKAVQHMVKSFETHANQLYG
jgi:coenzyme Q-binding protein COQ10